MLYLTIWLQKSIHLECFIPFLKKKFNLIYTHFITINYFNDITELKFSLFTANTGLYAHYVFNTLDSDRSGIVSFEVRMGISP